MTSEDDLDSGTLECKHCPKKFKYDSEKKRHEESHFPHFECEICSKKFSFVSALRRHQKQHERTGNVKCQECRGKFRDETLLQRHMKYAHKDDPSNGTITCMKCNALFNSEMALSAHMKTHKPESERRFKCGYEGCLKSFNFSHHLKHHELTHTNEKQHYCGTCGKGFIQYHHLKAHLKTHDPGKWLYCTVPGCAKKYSTEYARKRHVATHTNRPDSGISSDSNSLDASSKDLVLNTVLCSLCGESVLDNLYKIHKQACKQRRARALENMLRNLNNDMDEKWDEVKNDNGIVDCKAAIGGCIMGGGTDKCVCAQISNTMDDVYDLTPIKHELPSSNKAKFQANNVCSGCECGNNFATTTSHIDTVQIKKDGIVKIINTDDIDIPIEDFKQEVKIEALAPFNSCKFAIGDCIVSGNGTMGEGCLCARMISDDEQRMAQEIDDLTPRPKM